MKNPSPWLWLGLITALIAVQFWIIPTMINAVTGAEWFKGRIEEGGDNLPVSNDNTAIAFSHCNRHLEQMQPEHRFQFSTTPTRSWDLGFNRYMIQGSARLSNAGTDEPREYLCRLQYDGGDVRDAANWTIAGFEFTSP